ncbi:MAG: FAD-binding protein [Kouleothrix sp.]
MGVGERNWAGNLAYSAARFHRPATVEQVQVIVRASSKLRALGSRHSFNTIADTPADLVSLERLDKLVALDRERGTVTVEAGIKYGHLGAYLHGEGFALHNMASLPHISVAGACATATHGSGDRNGNLATAVTALEFVAADGELVTLSRERDGDTFLGAVVGLGALGVVTRMTLAVEPAFSVQQEVCRAAGGAARGQLEAIESGPTRQPVHRLARDAVNEVWLKRRLPATRRCLWRPSSSAPRSPPTRST